MEEQHANALDAVAELVSGVAPADVRRELARLDQQLTARLCRPDADAPADGVAPGMAYWLLRDALTRRAADA